jgi:TetR/AcrR family transcriptional regulator, transcriptional repressor of aconitase
MPRPRFQKLTPAKQSAILAVAADEFAAHGLQGASFNRIIESAGLSKGAMYYYFDDKEDLYLAVLKDALGQVMIQLGEFPGADSPAAFWDSLRAMYFRVLDAYRSSPQQVSLARGFLRSLGSPRVKQTYVELEQSAAVWFAAILSQGQAVGAVRNDIADDLLLAGAFGLLEGTDRWLIDRWETLSESALSDAASAIFSMLQRVLQKLPDLSK